MLIIEDAHKLFAVIFITFFIICLSVWNQDQFRHWILIFFTVFRNCICSFIFWQCLLLVNLMSIEIGLQIINWNDYSTAWSTHATRCVCPFAETGLIVLGAGYGTSCCFGPSCPSFGVKSSGDSCFGHLSRTNGGGLCFGYPGRFGGIGRNRVGRYSHVLVGYLDGYLCFHL